MIIFFDPETDHPQKKHIETYHPHESPLFFHHFLLQNLIDRRNAAMRVAATRWTGDT